MCTLSPPLRWPLIRLSRRPAHRGALRYSNHYGRDWGAGGADRRIAGGRRIVAAAARRCAGGSGQVAGSGRAARPDEAGTIAVLVATAGRLAERPTAPTTLPATSNLYSPRCRYCAAHECRDRQRDRNILLSKPLPGGSLKVVVARAPRDLRSYQLGRALPQGHRGGVSCTTCPPSRSIRTGASAFSRNSATPRRWGINGHALTPTESSGRPAFPIGLLQQPIDSP